MYGGRPPRSVYARGKRKRKGKRGEREGERVRAKRRQFGALCSLIAFNYTCPALRSAAIATLYAGTAKLLPEVPVVRPLPSLR